MAASKKIQNKLMKVILMTSGAVLLLTCTAFFAYEFITFRQDSIQQLSTLGKIIASNSTAALAFDDEEEASEILSALQAEPHIVTAALFNEEGELFSFYPPTKDSTEFPAVQPDGYGFEGGAFGGFTPVTLGGKRLGTLYLKSDMGAIYERFILYTGLMIIVTVLSFFLAYFLSKRLQRRISKPILALADTAKSVSEKHDYSVRATKFAEDEVGLLTDSFNIMLTQIQQQNEALNENRETILEFSQRLEQMVIERTNELEQVNKELEAFSYSVSHDLRAPLRSIHGYSTILAEDYTTTLDEDAHKLLQTILRNSQYMGRLIDDLLAFSRLGRKEIARTTVTMKDMVEAIVEDQKQIAGPRIVEVTIHELPPAHADGGTLKQVWVNLIANAFKYSRQKEKSLIEIGSFNKDNSCVYYIKDNGAGFEMEYYDKLFGVFQRLHSQKEFEGTGVGLATVQRIIAKHGGIIWAEGKVNEGATFYFTLGNQEMLTEEK